MRSQALASGVHQSTPMTVPPASRIDSSSVAVPVPKWMTGTPVLCDVGEDVPHVGLHVLDVVGGREVAHPRVEELHGVGPGRDLRAEVAAHDLAELLHERAPGVGLAEHELLGLGEVRALAALDQVAREGERRARRSR